MITVISDLRTYNVTIDGHACYAEEKGKDIVCAAVSILCYTLIEELTANQDKLMTMEVSDDQQCMKIMACPQEAYVPVIDALFEFFVKGTLLLHDHYPNNVLSIVKG